MSDATSAFDELIIAVERLGFSHICPDCDGSCCKMPWITTEEGHIEDQFPESVVLIRDTRFVLDREKCAFLNEAGKCKIYSLRPLDCRLFPLDVIESDGAYYWCVFQLCQNWESLQDQLMPMLAELENRFSPNLWKQFVNQIKVTKEIYTPYKLGSYKIIKKVEWAKVS